MPKRTSNGRVSRFNMNHWPYWIGSGSQVGDPLEWLWRWHWHKQVQTFKLSGCLGKKVGYKSFVEQSLNMDPIAATVASRVSQRWLNREVAERETIHGCAKRRKRVCYMGRRYGLEPHSSTAAAYDRKRRRLVCICSADCFASFLEKNQAWNVTCW